MICVDIAARAWWFVQRTKARGIPRTVFGRILVAAPWAMYTSRRQWARRDPSWMYIVEWCYCRPSIPRSLLSIGWSFLETVLLLPTLICHVWHDWFVWGMNESCLTYMRDSSERALDRNLVHMYMNICVYICMRTYIYIYIYTYVYIYISTFTYEWLYRRCCYLKCCTQTQLSDGV